MKGILPPPHLHSIKIVTDEEALAPSLQDEDVLMCFLPQTQSNPDVIYVINAIIEQDLNFGLGYISNGSKVSGYHLYCNLEETWTRQKESNIYYSLTQQLQLLLPCLTLEVLQKFASWALSQLKQNYKTIQKCKSENDDMNIRSFILSGALQQNTIPHAHTWHVDVNNYTLIATYAGNATYFLPNVNDEKTLKILNNSVRSCCSFIDENCKPVPAYSLQDTGKSLHKGYRETIKSLNHRAPLSNKRFVGLAVTTTN